MLIYNPKDWWKLIFYFHKADTFRKLLPAMMGVMAYTFFISYLENNVFHFVPLKNPLAIHSLVGFVLSLLLVFRTNSSYDRWWEGRKIWGSFTNNSRNLALKLSAILPDNHESKEVFRILVGNYLLAVKDYLRGQVNLEHLDYVGNYNEDFYANYKHIPNRIGQAIHLEISRLYKEGIINAEQLIILNGELVSFTDNLGACERIRNTPIPSSYNIFIKKMIFLYVFTMPFGFVLEFKFWAAPIVTLIFYAFAGIEMIAEEIEDPFGTDSNDLALDTIVKNVKNNLSEIFKN
ncbi:MULTISPECIES: bestrophin family protein [Emticicia]|uniref:bestrophin family protein n=1 Tax=Emticicia TaxID=312278 RepID=UPI0007D8C469|nr:MULTISPECIES: bestrophin family ion channel [Emticicia]